MTTLFSSKDLETIAREIKARQNYESQWTDENGKAVDIEGELIVEDIEVGIDMFVAELKRRFPVDGEEIDYYSDDTPRLTDKH